MYISVGVGRLGEPKVGVPKRRVRQSVTISPKLETVVRATRKPHPSPEVKKRFDTDLVIVLVTLWGKNQEMRTRAYCSWTKAENETQRRVRGPQLTTMRSSEYLTFPFSTENEV